MLLPCIILKSLDGCINNVYIAFEVIFVIATIQKWGSSHGIRLPKVFLDELEIGEGNKVEILKQDNFIIIKPQRRKTIQELFAGYDGDYTPETIDWGEPEGGEIW